MGMDMSDAFVLEHGLRGTLRRSEPMARHVSWRAGGTARIFYQPADVDDLRAFLRAFPPPQPVLFVGLGSNLLVRDGGFDGAVVLSHHALTGIAVEPGADGFASPDAGPRVFELRTYTTTPNNLPVLHARFRDHTMALFAKHGMTNLFYWQLLPDQAGAENTLIYMLAHASQDAAKASFDAFRADPDWIAAKTASEIKGGGSLTIPDGVKSVFLKATDYSPTH